MLTLLPKEGRDLWAVGFRIQARSSGVPGKSKVIAARPAIVAPKNKKTPIAANPGGLPLPSIRFPRFILRL